MMARMTDEIAALNSEVAALRTENAELKTEVARLMAAFEAALAYIVELEAQSNNNRPEEFLRPVASMH